MSYEEARRQWIAWQGVAEAAEQEAATLRERVADVLNRAQAEMDKGRPGSAWDVLTRGCRAVVSEGD